MNKIDESNFVLYAAQCYDNQQCIDESEFFDDLKRFKYLKRLFNKYHQKNPFLTLGADFFSAVKK